MVSNKRGSNKRGYNKRGSNRKNNFTNSINKRRQHHGYKKDKSYFQDY